MATVPEIIEGLGGATAIATKIGVPLTTVHSWKRAAYVPAWRVPALVALSKKVGRPLSVGDFPAERPTRKPSDTQGIAA